MDSAGRQALGASAAVVVLAGLPAVLARPAGPRDAAVTKSSAALTVNLTGDEGGSSPYVRALRHRLGEPV